LGHRGQGLWWGRRPDGMLGRLLNRPQPVFAASHGKPMPQPANRNYSPLHLTGMLLAQARQVKCTVTAYSGIDLHSDNSVVAIIEDADRVVAQKRLPNDITKIVGFLAQWQDELTGVVVESTYNWYWLVDD
jgi:hypothetical protein